MLTSLRGALERRHLPTRPDVIELLDSGTLSPADVGRNLTDLARMNRLPGGTAASVAGVRRLVDRPIRLRVLDAGTGRADMPLAFARRGWRTVALDPNPDVLLVAERETAREPAIEVVAGDVRALPFADGAFDVAHGSLLIHHFDPDDAVIALRELARVATRGVVINDLRRGLLPLAATWLTVTTLGRSAVTRQDGIVSARRAYTLDELDGLLDRAGLAVRWRSSRWLPRVVTAASAP